MSPRFRTIDRQTRLLLPYDLRDWIPEDDMVHFVIESVESLRDPGFKINKRGTGSEQYPPSMMLSLLIYCYAHGIFSSRRIERATYRDIAVRYITADTHPDHDTIATFRRENKEVLSACFVHMLSLAKEMGVLKVGTVSTDGTQIKANASKHKNVTYKRAGELQETIKKDVAELLSKAEEADVADRETGEVLPGDLKKRERLLEKMRQARERLEQRSRDRAAAERAAYEEKVERREKRQGRRKGKKIQEPEEFPDDDEQINLVDPDSRLMRKNKRSSYEQCYNAQATVDADGSQLVLSARVSQCASDRNELERNIKGIPPVIGKAKRALADSGYACEQQVKEVEASGTEVYVVTGAESRQIHRRYDYRPEHRKKERTSAIRKPWIKQMKDKMETDGGRRLYARRKQSVEPVFGIIKQVIGFRQFLLRGYEKVTAEWCLVMLSYNVKRLWNLQKVA